MLATSLRSTALRRLAASAASQSRYASTLVIANHADGALNGGTLSTITAATQIGGDVTVLVPAGDAATAESAASVAGVSKVLHADDPAYAHGLAENMTEAVLAAQEAGNYTHILAPANNWAKNFLPRVAVKLNVAMVGDVTGVEGEDTFVRPTYAGNAMATVKSNDAIKVCTVRGTAFEKAATEGGSAAVEAAPAAAQPDAGMSTWVSEQVSESDRPDLTAANTIISGGRGMKNGENFEMLYKVADKLGGAVGASRAAVDAGFVPNDLQIGQTGKVVAPQLYVAVGISGAIQHIAGMKDSKTIVAINKDAEAPIFQVSDYGLVADLFNAVPELESKI